MAIGNGCSWGSPGGFPHWVAEWDVALGSHPSASKSLNMQQVKEKRLVVKDNWYSSEFGRLRSKHRDSVSHNFLRKFHFYPWAVV